jgi:outer membrane protein assembly factor BamD
MGDFRKMMRITNIALILVAALLISCASSEIKTITDAKKSYDYGVKLLGERKFMTARETFTEIKNKMPDSSFAVLSELRIADSYFDEEMYTEAIAAYQVFEELHPRHKDREYVIYRIGLSYFNDTPEAIARDLEPAVNTIKVFKRLLSMFPKTKYKKDTVAKMNTSRTKLMEKEYYIANYYFIRDHFKSSLDRYENVYKKYSDLKNEILRKSLSELFAAYGELKDAKNQARVKALFTKNFPKTSIELD